MGRAWMLCRTREAGPVRVASQVVSRRWVMDGRLTKDGERYGVLL